jgi:hypothetical protein
VINNFEFFIQVSFIFVGVCTLFCMHWWKATCILVLVMGMPRLMRGSSWVRSCLGKEGQATDTHIIEYGKYVLACFFSRLIWLS